LLASVLLALAPSQAQARETVAHTHVPAPDVPHEIAVPGPDEVGPDVFTAAAGVPFSPPSDPQVGDSWVWWLWVHDPMPPHFEQAVCTVRGMSGHAYVVVRDEEWLVSVDQADVDMILERWENSSIGPWPSRGIYENDSLAFGAPPDALDEDPRIYLVWFDFGIASDGFFFWFDEYPDGAYPQYHSNECEALYLNPYSSGGPSGNYMLAVAAHEFEHMIHWNHDDNEESWVDEGMAEMGMWLYGAPDNISSFNSNPDNTLTSWTGAWADYIKTYLWSLYFYERYGGLQSLYDVVHEPANSVQGYENVLDALGYPADFDDVFADWIVANYLDDTTIEDGRFGYEGDDLPAFAVAATYSAYPVSDVYKTVNHWAADYYRFQSIGTLGAIELQFDGADDNSFAVWGLSLFADGTVEVHRMALDAATQAGYLILGGFSDPADKVILAVGSTSATGGTGYYFSALQATGIEPEEEPGAILSGLRASPNPFSSTIGISMDWTEASAAPAVEVFDLGGRLVKRLDPPETTAERAFFEWNGRGTDGNPSPAGVYIARVSCGGISASIPLMLLGTSPGRP